MEQAVRRLVDELLRPLVEADGGRIELVSLDEEAVVVELGAACAGCPGIHYTRDHVIAPALRTVVPAELRVEVRRGASRPA